MAEDPDARQSAGEGTDEVQRVDLDALAGNALCELPAGGAVEHELKGLAVDTGPLCHNVGDKAAVVIGRQLHGAADGSVDVDTVRPDVAGESDVE